MSQPSRFRFRSTQPPIRDENGYLFHEVSDSMLQSTGLADKNGTEIFEGDIVRFDRVNYFSDHEEPAWAVGVVKWQGSSDYMYARPCFEVEYVRGTHDRMFYDEMGSNFMWDELEVLGNVYENEELLSNGEEG